MIEDNYRTKGLRNKLVKVLDNKGITNQRLLHAIGKVPRHSFFDNALVGHAYQDKAFPIGEGQTISQPYTVAFQTEKLDVRPGDKVLEIGTGSGYQACILLEMGAKVYTIEYNRALFERAKARLDELGYHPFFYYGDGSKGIPAKAPFDKVLVTAGAPVIPPALIDQLAEGGRLVIPVGGKDKQMMVLLKKEHGQITRQAFDYFVFVPLLGEQGWHGS